MNTENSHSGRGKMDEQLRRSSDSWNSGEAPDMWESLNESLSVEKVWKGVSDSLEKEQFAIDNQLRATYADWDADAPSDIWGKLDESLSVEKVWTNVNASLATRSIPSRSGWFRVAAACILILFFARNLNDEQVISADNSSTAHPEINVAFNSSEVAPGQNSNSGTDPEHTSTYISGVSRNNNNFSPVKKRNTGNPAEENGKSNSSVQNELTENNVVVSPVSPNETASLTDSLQYNNREEELVSELPYNSYAHNSGLEAFNFPKEKKRYDHVLIQIGTQLANIRDVNASSLSTSKTRVGLAADIAYRQRFGNLQLTGALGVSQFTQEQGKYVNARYRNTQQKINMAQFSVCLGYNYRKMHFYAGPMLSNALTALEFNGSTITQVYNFRTVEPGITAGVDYRLFDLGRKSNGFMIGAQYQYLPDNKLNSNLNQIHGLRLQAKFSF